MFVHEECPVFWSRRNRLFEIRHAKRKPEWWAIQIRTRRYYINHMIIRAIFAADIISTNYACPCHYVHGCLNLVQRSAFVWNRRKRREKTKMIRGKRERNANDVHGSRNQMQTGTRNVRSNEERKRSRWSKSETRNERSGSVQERDDLQTVRGVENVIQRKQQRKRSRKRKCKRKTRITTDE